MPERGWTLIGSISESEIFIPVYTQLGMLTGGILFIVAVSLALALRLINRLLKENEMKLESQVLELHDVYANLEKEIAECQLAQSTLRDWNAALRIKVRKRVRQLQEIRAALKAETAKRQAVQAALQQRVEEIQRMAYIDVLTGMPNRACLDKRLAEELANSEKPSGVILFIDLDNLQMINDTFGHKCGDEIIVISGNRIMAAAGDAAFAARLGGDEFVVILPGESDRESVAQFADKLLKALSREVEARGIRFHLSASIGIAFYPADGDTAEELCKNADNAMYAAKNAGKGCQRFYEAVMQTEAYEKILLTNNLFCALEKDELLLHYQPQVNIAAGAIIGFEALLRWNNPEHGLVLPVRFISLAEQHGLINAIGKWVLREACQFIRRLSTRGQGQFYVAVNVSPYQLHADDFVDIVCEALHNADIEPCRLELEITENVLMSSLEEGTRKLAALRKMGVRLSLDDFGTGYSSLTYLQRLPIDTLKIDKAFIDMLNVDEAKKNIVGTIVNMAHSMDMKVVAEGVETRKQLDYLVQCRCDLLQGYIISKPLPEDEVVPFLAGWHNKQL
jgi:diguanylate cyclase (GGDEF)-like protein